MSNLHNDEWIEAQVDIYRSLRSAHNYVGAKRAILRLKRAGFAGEAHELMGDMIKHRKKWWEKNGLCGYCGAPQVYVGKKIAECDCQK
jgi:hypothetical protein